MEKYLETGVRELYLCNVRTKRSLPPTPPEGRGALPLRGLGDGCLCSYIAIVVQVRMQSRDSLELC